MNQAADEGTLRRLRKLLALGTDERANPAEAAAAMAQAQRIMDRYGVTELSLAGAEVAETRVESTSHVRPAVWENSLVGLVSDAFGCETLWVTSGWKGAMRKAKWQFIGLKHNVEMVGYVFQVLQRQVLKARAEFVRELPDWATRPEKAADADSFCVALNDAQRAAIAARKRKELGENADSEPVKSRNTDGSYASFAQGNLEGRSAYLNRPMPGAGEGPALLEKKT